MLAGDGSLGGRGRIRLHRRRSRSDLRAWRFRACRRRRRGHLFALGGMGSAPIPPARHHDCRKDQRHEQCGCRPRSNSCRSCHCLHQLLERWVGIGETDQEQGEQHLVGEPLGKGQHGRAVRREIVCGVPPGCPAAGFEQRRAACPAQARTVAAAQLAHPERDVLRRRAASRLRCRFHVVRWIDCSALDRRRAPPSSLRTTRPLRRRGSTRRIAAWKQRRERTCGPSG